MHQVNLVELHNNDREQLLTEKDTMLANSERLPGFVQEYQVMIIRKLNQKETRIMLMVMSLEAYLSIILFGYLELTAANNLFEVYQFFPYVIMTVLMVEIVLKINLTFNLKREAHQFYDDININHLIHKKKNLSQTIGQDQNKELICLWGILQLEIFYIQCLSRKLQEYTQRILEYESNQNQIKEQQVCHQSIQAIYSYMRFRQLYVTLKICIFLLLLNNIYGKNSSEIVVLVIYISFLTLLNIWFNYHIAVVYLFCRSFILSLRDFVILICEISIKCSHSLMFLYLLTHLDGVYIIFSSAFICICSIMGATITIQLNTNFDAQYQGIFDMVFLGYSVNYYIGLKHREYFVKNVAYTYKKDLLKQFIIFIIQLAIILYYYYSNLPEFNIHEQFVIGLISALFIIRVSMTLFKITYYLKPKQILIRLKTFSGVPHFIEETITSPQTLNPAPNNLRELWQQQQEIQLQQQQQYESELKSEVNSATEKDLNTCPTSQIPQLNKCQSKNNQRRLLIQKLITQKLELSPYKLTFYSDQDIYEFEQTQELQLILSELIKYKKTELIFLISNQIKIFNQYGHINVLIHRYNKELMLFIERFIIPDAGSIQIDSCYEHNSDIYIQLILLYNTINKEFDVNTKITLQPQDMISKLPVNRHQKNNQLKAIRNVINSKMITILKIIIMNRIVSQYLYQSSCYVLYDLAQID
ncbi:transmembrane protein, putative (macronuclear) [Tetrahymena thermophila SB210]|uniref:Transmembrane protein, putative n=1 Tax=Tetrahymena thermophila (strain SB210) TaxID=312017 RepID=Q23FD1_TETTS|nr:transmembrane protein, putative [Tetrahymena thermophila SB210]EAR95222.1 transmembrane protein, putative [Tetrahymena thermophila SB210]|eukprot:XP_001015467.1 transmembrane protein, putative [Tetrahymena thermophila SB210]